MGSLKRVLGYRSVLLIAINAIIGSGVFFLPAVGASISGNASIYAWIILSVLALYTATCIGELASMFPKAGGIYEFSKQAYGRFTSFLIGWISWLVGNVTAAMLVVGGIDYLLPVNQFAASQLFYLAVIKTIFSLLLILVFNLVAYRGMKLSAGILITFAVITISLILILIIPSIPHINVSNFSTLFEFKDLYKQLTLIFLTVFFIAETFFGHEAICFLAEETKEPHKVIPKALVWGTVAIIVLVLSLVIVSLGVIPAAEFGQMSAPYAELASIVIGSWAVPIVKLLTYLVIIGAAAGWVITSPRLLMALAQDRLFPHTFQAIHHIYGTPHKAIAFQTVATSIFVLLAFNGSGYKTLLEILVPLVLIMLSAVLLSVTILRYKQPDTKRHMTVPFGKIGPGVVVVFQLSLVGLWLFYNPEAPLLLRTALSFILLALPIYLLITVIYNQKINSKFQSVLAYFSLIYENFLIPRSLRKRVISNLGNVRNKNILELGCSAGTVTKLLCKNVGKDGQIITTDCVERDVTITKKRMRNYSNIKTVYVQSIEKIPENLPALDGIIAVGTVSAIRNIEPLLKKLNKKMKKGSKICFLEFDKFFWMLPNIEWIGSNQSINTLFKHAGFDVKIEREQGLFMQHIYVTGVKK